MTTLIATISLGLSIAGLAGMLWWRWFETERRSGLTRLRRGLSRFDRRVIKAASIGLGWLGWLARGATRALYRHLPDILFDGGLRVSYFGYRSYIRLSGRLRCWRREKKRRSAETSVYMKALKTVQPVWRKSRKKPAEPHPVREKLDARNSRRDTETEE